MKKNPLIQVLQSLSRSNQSGRRKGKAGWLTAVLVAIVMLINWGREQLQSYRLQTQPLTNITARCMKVIDGDTIDVEWPGKKNQRIRVLGIDCPETFNKEKAAKQARRYNLESRDILTLGDQAKNYLRHQALNRNVVLVFPKDKMEVDDYDRLLCYIEQNQVDLGAELLRRGLAEARSEPHPRRVYYEKLLDQARYAKSGIHRARRR